MKKFSCKKRSVVVACALMMAVQMMGMTGCAAKDDAQGSGPQIVDNDLVVDVECNGISFKVGESWTPAEDNEGVYYYPGGDFIYMVSMYGTYNDKTREDNFFNYALEEIRKVDFYKNVLVISGEEPYVTADGRDAFISRLKIIAVGGNMEITHDADLLVIPEDKFFVLFHVAHEAEETAPLDIRELVDTATFDFDIIYAGR